MLRPTFLFQAAPYAVAFALIGFVQAGGHAADSPRETNVQTLKAVSLLEPAAHRVYQRDLAGRAEIPVLVDPSLKDARVTSATLSGVPQGSYWFADGKLHGIPTGGPYTLNAVVNAGGVERNVFVGPLFVGDLWVLAGQSNMQGYGDLIDVTPPDPRVMSLEMNGQWVQAKEPLHAWLLDPAHQKVHPKGAGLGLSFAKTLVEQTSIPIGLLPCAVGGTSMAQWDPAKKSLGRQSLYGSMLDQIKKAGGQVKGLLWYQGEAESNEANSKTYPKVFPAFIAAVRDDLHQPDLPFYLVQIARFAVLNESACNYWNSVQETQRRIPERVPRTAVVSAIDVELDDAIHLGTQGLKRVGHRLARVALREIYGRPGATTPDLEKVVKGPEKTLILKFKGVNIGPDVADRPRRFAHPEDLGSGLRPRRHIAGFSIRNVAGAEVVAIFDASVERSGDTVILHLADAIPKKAQLWYGRCHNPYCNLTDSLDMAVPAFGPIELDDVK